MMDWTAIMVVLVLLSEVESTEMDADIPDDQNGHCSYKCEEKRVTGGIDTGGRENEMDAFETHIVEQDNLLNITSLYRPLESGGCNITIEHEIDPECTAWQCGQLKVQMNNNRCSLYLQFEPISDIFCREKDMYFNVEAVVEGDRTVVVTMKEHLDVDHYYKCKQNTIQQFERLASGRDTINFEFDAAGWKKPLQTDRGSFLLVVSQKHQNIPSILTIDYKFEEIRVATSGSGCRCEDSGFISVDCQCINLLYSKEPKTWTQAVSHCRTFQNSSSRLWTIHDEEVYGQVQKLVRSEWGQRRMLGDTKAYVFIGLQTIRKEGRDEERWIDDSPLAWTEWYHPAYKTQVPGIDLIFDETKMQPNPNLNYVCTALHVGESRSFWIKLPCTYPAINIAYICTKPGIPKPSEPLITVAPTPPAPPNQTYCLDGWYEFDNACHTVLSSHSLYNCTTALFGTTEEDLGRLCEEYSAEVATIPQDIVGSRFFKYWISEMRPQIGGVLCKDEKGELKSIQPEHDYLRALEDKQIFSYLLNETDYILQFKTCENSTLNYFLNPNRTLELKGNTNVICRREVTEVTLECRENMYQCRDLTCIAIDRRCDGVRDCDDDEEDCEAAEMYQCETSNTTIPYSRVCDFIRDCPFSDDEDCSLKECEPYQFRCKNGQCINQNQICNFHLDCRDGSDEAEEMCDNRCVELPCIPKVKCRGFTCFSGKCIPSGLENDLQVDCESAEEDEGNKPDNVVRGNWVMTVQLLRGQSLIRLKPYRNYESYCPKPHQARCHEYHERCFDRSQICVYDHDQYGTLKGCRDGSHLRGCRDHACMGFFKCPESYCLPIRKVCDGVRDCPDGFDEEELICGNYTCPGGFRCRGSDSCLDLKDVCDGTVHCPLNHDDERLCPDLECVDNCSCSGFELTCSDQNLTMVSFDRRLRFIKIVNGSVDLEKALENLNWLIYLNITSSRIDDLKVGIFDDLKNVQIIDLSYNRITIIRSYLFKSLGRLRVLNLEGNPLSSIESNAFSGLESVTILDLSLLNISQIEEYAFVEMDSLQILNLSQNSIQTIPDTAFNELTTLRELDLTTNQISVLEPTVFEALKIRSLYTDNFRFCCAANQSIQGLHCTPETDEFSSCFDLMASGYLQIAIWIMGITALVGNLGVFIYRLTHDRHLVTSMLVMNLSISDLLMGIYLIIIASADTYYRGRYVIYDEQWRHGPMCKLAGALNLLSSEMSVIILLIMSLDRAVAITFPFSAKRLDTSSTKIILAIGWVIGLIIAIIPLINMGFFENFYGRNAPCLPFDVNSSSPTGWEYSFALVIFNFISFLVILFAYVVIYIEIRRTREAVKSNRSNAKSTEMTFLSKVTLIVVSNFCAWFPVLILKFMALNGLTIPQTASAWMAVFVLPVNASVNPCLYTLSAITARKPTVTSQQTYHSNVYSVNGQQRAYYNNKPSSK